MYPPRPGTLEAICLKVAMNTVVLAPKAHPGVYNLRRVYGLHGASPQRVSKFSAIVLLGDRWWKTRSKQDANKLLVLYSAWSANRCVEHMLEHMQREHVRDRALAHALKFSAAFDNPELVIILLDAGADPCTLDYDGEMPIWTVVRRDLADIGRLMLERHPNAWKSHSKFPIVLAARNWSIKFLVMLREFDVKISRAECDAMANPKRNPHKGVLDALEALL